MLPFGILQQQIGIVVPPEWTPADLAGLYSWVEVGDINDFYQDSSKTTPVTATGQPVGAWVDKSGNGHDFIQWISPNYRPTYQGTYLDPDGNGDQLTFAAGDSYAIPNQMMIGIRFRYQDTAASQGIFCIAPSGENGTPFLLANSLNSTTYQIYVDGGYQRQCVTTANTLQTLVIRVTKPSTNYLVDFWHNGTKLAQYDGGTSMNGIGQSWWPWIMTGYTNSGANDFLATVLANGSYTDTDAENLSAYLDTFS